MKTTKRMATIGRVALVLAMGLGAFVEDASALQQKKGAEKQAEPATAEQKLAQGKLIAESEHDYARALELLAAVATDASVKSDVRAQALVAAARCLNQLGRGDEAKVQLQAAAQLNGPGADEAKHLLDAGFTDQQLELRIAKAVDEVMNSATSGNFTIQDLTKTQSCQDLIWVGAPAVPRLVRFLGDVDHLANVSVATFLLASINTDAAATAVRDALKQADPFYKRAVLAAFPPNTVWTDPIRAAVMTLLNDPDAHVRQWVLSDAARLAKVEELLPMTRDADDAVRKSAWQAIGSKESRGNGTDVEPLVAALRRCLKEDRDEVRLEAVELLRATQLLQCDAGRALFTETLLDPVLTAPVNGKSRPKWLQAVETGELNFDRPVPIDLLLHTAEKLGTVEVIGADGSERYPVPGGYAFSLLVQKSANAVTGGRPQTGWPAEERAKVFELLRFGVGQWMGNWIAANVTAENLPAIAENAAAAGDLGSISVALKRPGIKLTPAQRSAVAKSVLRLFEGDTSEWEQPATKAASPPRRWMNTVLLLTTLGDDEADRAVVRAQAAVPELNALSFLLPREDPPVDPHRYVELLTMKAGRGGDASRLRNSALRLIAATHLPELPKLLAPCYELKLEAKQTRSNMRPRGIVWMVGRDSDDDDGVPQATSKSDQQRVARAGKRLSLRTVWGPSYSAADFRDAFEACALTGAPEFWRDVATAIELLPIEGPFDPVATALLESVATNVARITEYQPNVQETQRKRLVALILQRRVPGWSAFALANVLDRELGGRILDFVPEIAPELLQKVLEARAPWTSNLRAQLVRRLHNEKDEAIRARAADFLRDPSGSVRKYAIEAVFVVAPDRALDLLLPLAKDSEADVRAALCAGLASTFDRRAIPILVDALQDPSSGVRDAAKKSLDSIQYVFEQKDKWKRMLDSAGLDSTNAAEALVKQAAATQPKATRLVAIESLGTLGVAETLPVLITFMGDGDAEIAAAAKAAVARINRRTAEKETAPAKDH